MKPISAFLPASPVGSKPVTKQTLGLHLALSYCINYCWKLTVKMTYSKVSKFYDGRKFLVDLGAGRKLFKLVGNTEWGTLLPGKPLFDRINMFNFRSEDGFKMNIKYFPAISRILYLSTETIRRPPQSHETIPLTH
jgi:hypothetical protein